MTNQQRKSFGSDNHSGAHPLVLDAMVAANAGDVTSYGADPLTERVTRQLCDAFGAAGAFLVLGGTAANVLGLSVMLQPWEGAICAESAHVNDDECGAAERIVGSKLLAVPTADGKLTPDLIATRLTGRGKLRRTQPRAVVITQSQQSLRNNRRALGCKKIASRPGSYSPYYKVRASIVNHTKAAQQRK